MRNNCGRLSDEDLAKTGRNITSLERVYKAAVGNLNPFNDLSELIIEEIKDHQS